MLMLGITKMSLCPFCSKFSEFYSLWEHLVLNWPALCYVQPSKWFPPYANCHGRAFGFLSLFRAN